VRVGRGGGGADSLHPHWNFLYKWRAQVAFFDWIQHARGAIVRRSKAHAHERARWPVVP